MSEFQLQSLDIDDISRAAKQGVRVDTKYEVQVNTDAPLKGVTKKQRDGNSEVADVLDIGDALQWSVCVYLNFVFGVYTNALLCCSTDVVNIERL
jgi:hypothetical protein